MARDTTPDKVKIANHDFTNENHREVANLLNDEWEELGTLKAFAEKYDGADGLPAHSKSMFHKAYKMYIGVDGSQFGDGIEDPRTVEEIKRDHGTFKDYKEDREDGKISRDDFRKYLDEEELEPREPVQPDREGMDGMVSIEKALEWRDKARDEAYDKGFERGLKAGREVERENGSSLLAHEDIFEGADS